jgi:hypothetical protein
MTASPAALAASIILLFPMGYFFLAAPAFLFVKLDIPQVTQLLRGMFNVQFVMMGITGAIGTLVLRSRATRPLPWPLAWSRSSQFSGVAGFWTRWMPS